MSRRVIVSVCLSGVWEQKGRIAECISLEVINMAEQQNDAKKQYNPEQLLFIQWLANPKREGTQNEFAVSVNVHFTTLSRWKNIPGFMDAVYNESLKYLEDDLPEIIGAMSKEAKTGNVKAAELVLQLAKKWTPKQIQENTGKVVFRITKPGEEDGSGD